MRTMRKNFLSVGLAAMSLCVVGCSTADEDVSYEGYKLYSLADNDMIEMPEAGGDKFEDFTDNPFVKTSKEPVSTFSVDADGASYAIMRRHLADGYNIAPASVRIEEFLNYFTFNYASPKGDESCCGWASKEES